MATKRFMTNDSSYARRLSGLGLMLILLGFLLIPAAQAQEAAQPVTATPAALYGSIFDSPAQASATPSAATTAVITASATASPAAPAATAAPATGAATRIPSIFDPPAQQPTTVPDSGAATRIPSIFDPPAQQPTAAPDSGAATRVPSIFDAPAQPTTAPAGDTGRIGSIFDTPAQATPAPGTGSGSIGSIFDTMQQNDVIRYPGDGQPSTEYCLSCHANPYLQMTLPSGESISVTFDEEAYAASVHGQHGTAGYLCIRCHVGMNEYPHPPVAAETARDLTIEMSTSCSRCHTDIYDETADGAHFALLANGNHDAAVCSDCHTGHAVQQLRDPVTRAALPEAGLIGVEMCADCHAEISARYAQSVHGAALLEGNPDVPTCSDCHGVHSVQGPTTNTAFKLFSPDICATCHADQDLMAKYGINTDVFNTYVADFHGTTVSIFQHTAAGQDFNSPVCIDCHGVHDMVAVSAENSPLLKDNLVGICQRCHPGATTNFPDSWLSHYTPSLERTPLTTIATVAYAILIPAVIGGLGAFVVTDVRRRRRNKREEDQHHGE